MADNPIATSTARETRFGPHLAASATAPTRALHRQFERNDGAASSLAVRQAHFPGDRRLIKVLAAKKRVAHTFDQPSDRREVDRDFVLEAIERRVARARDTA